MSGIRVELAVGSRGPEFSSLQTQWWAAFGELSADLSLAPQWTAIAARSAGLDDRLRMLGVVGADGTLRSFASYAELRQRQYALGILIRELPGNRLVAYHNELLGDAARDIVASLASNAGGACDVLYLPCVPRGSVTDAVIGEIASERGWRVIRIPGNRSPYIPIQGTWDGYLSRKSSNFRYTLNRKRKALQARGTVGYVRYDSPGGVAELLEIIGKVEAESWKADANMAITGSAAEQRYYAELLPWLAGAGKLAANVVMVGARPAAYSLCYHHCGRVAQLKTSFDEKFSDASPGLVVNAEAIRFAFELGAKEFDFLGDVMPHKLNWAPELREHDHHFVYTSTLKGRALGLAKYVAQLLRPKRAPSTIGRSGRRPERATT